MLPIKTHGTLTGYTRGCRCGECRRAIREYQRRHRFGHRGAEAEIDTEALSDLLNELFPLGLTDECPARRAMAA
jgi:hypothetical protein